MAVMRYLQLRKRRKNLVASKIEEALKAAAGKIQVGEVVEGEGHEESKELSAREKLLLARKKNLQRKHRSKLPTSLR